MLFTDKKINTRRLQHRRRERSGTIRLLIILILLCSLLLLLALYLYLAFFHSNKSKKTLSVNPIENYNQKTIAIQRTIADNKPEESDLNLFFDEIKDIYYNLSTVTVVGLELISNYSNDDILRPFDDEIKSAAVNSIRKIRRFKTLTYNMERNQEKFNLIYVFLDTYATLIRVQRLAHLITKSNDGIKMIFNNDYIFGETLNINQDIQLNILIGSRILDPLLRVQIKIMELYRDELKLFMNNILNKEVYENVILRIKEDMLKTTSRLMIKRKIEINGWPEQSIHNNVDEDPAADSGNDMDENGHVIKEAFLIQAQNVLEEFVLLCFHPIYILMFEFKEKEKDFEQSQLILRKEFKDQIKIGAEFKYRQEEGNYIKLSVDEIYNDVVHDLEEHCSGVFAEYLTENHSDLKFYKIHCFDAMEKAFILVSAGPVIHPIFN
eukprot:GAHX01000762.1.p1 GENE.GAHX01000762.1~~GAHX01000762.1.p1  ORF type:complete len:437 (+),score=58.90 GAHX01000762.1:484-1794(+)